MKKMKLWAMLLMAAFTMGAVCACGDDDDDDGGGGGNVPSPQITGTDGTAIRLTSLGYQSGSGKIDNEYYTFQYDSNGKLSGFGSSEFTYTMNGDNFSASYGKDQTITGSIKFETNSKGLVTRITFDTYSTVYNGDWDKTKGTWNFNYDGDNQLIGTSSTGTMEGYDKDQYGGEFKESGSGKQTFTWQNGNLIKVTSIGDETITVAGESYSIKDTETTNLTYSNELNPLRQNPYWEIKGVDALDLIGIFGVGPVNLPAKCVNEESSYEDGELDYETAYETTYTFTLNDNGAINTQTNSERTISSSFSYSGGGHSSTYYFGYDGNTTRSTDLEPTQVKDIVSAICAKLFKTHRKYKK